MQRSALPDASRVEAGCAGPEAVARPLDQPAATAESAGAYFQAIALACLQRFEINRDLFARTGEAEALHQTRVALRQLRSAFAIFRDVAVDDRFGHLRGELRWLAAATTETRDLDALAARMSPVPAPLARARRRASAQASKALASARAARLMADLAEWLVDGAWLALRTAAGQTAEAFATASLTRLRRKLARKARRLRKLDDRALHRVRIAAKKLRYAAGFFAALFPGDKAGRRSARFVDAMRTLQDDLGLVQDAAVAPATLARLRIPPADWPRLPPRAKLVRRAAADLERALACKRYWV